MTLPTLGLIGAGKVGTTLALSLADVPLTHLYNRTPAPAEWIAQQIGAIRVTHPLEVVRECDLTLIAVADDAISAIVQALHGEDLSGKGLIHTSGAHSLAVLAPLVTQGAMIGSFHPVLPFASVEGAQQAIRSAPITIALEADHPLLQVWLNALTSRLGGRSIILSSDSKGLYHAALVIASNYTVTLYAIAERLLIDLGASQTIADQALNTLMSATVDNLKTQGIPYALTGPLVRSDLATVHAHLTALDQYDPALAQLYRDLARLTYPLLSARGVSTDAIDTLIQSTP